MLYNSEEAIKYGQSRETDKCCTQDEEKQSKKQYVLDTTLPKQTQIT
jgi:hypothetical protein